VNTPVSFSNVRHQRCDATSERCVTIVEEAVSPVEGVAIAMVKLDPLEIFSAGSEEGCSRVLPTRSVKQPHAEHHD
jgi:hypothetical protein